jgi:hypothetical protein
MVVALGFLLQFGLDLESLAVVVGFLSVGGLVPEMFGGSAHHARR